ncbi:PhzF family phenazine biosynthesis protein [Microbulbifer sp. CnH-101-G]|uniref:PhzF family phenazine biosynthesis protein n=1 Tax=Microbulbifer sp. CnH-101-G TaxID=3243393 RepID=UPI00403A1414
MQKNMEINLYQVDAFASEVFSGNPATVCPLEEWLPDIQMQRIAEENNLSETAFFVPEGDGYRLRWFTPEAEVDLCGHATLATAHVLFKHLSYKRPVIHFETRSGLLKVEACEDGYKMYFPASVPTPVECPSCLPDALGVAPLQTLAAFDYIVVLNSEAELKSIKPNFMLLAELDLRGVVITAPGDHCDFVSRCFYPKLRVNEDPVTGSAHCELAPYWSQVLGKSRLSARQLSKRGGVLTCEVVNNEVILIGQAVDYMCGKIVL